MVKDTLRKELGVPPQTTHNADALCHTKVPKPHLQRGKGSTHRTNVLCGEGRRTRRDRTGSRLEQPERALQSAFDWLDLRSYDIRVTTQTKLVARGVWLCAPAHRLTRHRLVRALVPYQTATLRSHCAQAQQHVQREGALLPISADSLLSRASLGHNQALSFGAYARSTCITGAIANDGMLMPGRKRTITQAIDSPCGHLYPQ